jgi:hypothetical protein
VSEAAGPNYCSCNKEEAFTFHVGLECNVKPYSTAPKTTTVIILPSQYNLVHQYKQLNTALYVNYCVCVIYDVLIVAFPKYRLLKYETL